jgi:hypothetical protein
LASVSEDALTACFSARVAAWFAGGGRAEIEDPVYLRQMNMAVALAASRWNEFAEGENAVGRMRAWLDEVERRAVVRNANARVDAIRHARGWFEACEGANRHST